MALVDAPPVAADDLSRASFTGSASEYFGIWIVNILLTILTLGIYSAWAKVRRKRYFHGNTMLLGRTFEYHARGGQILVGRLIVVGVLVVLSVLSHIHPAFGLVTWLVYMVGLPWLIRRSLRFNARVTSYRNVRFDFVGTTGGAFVAVTLGGLVAFLTLGILAPLASRWLWRYILNNLRYGDRAFSADPRLGALYRAWVLPFLLFVLGGVMVGGGVAAMIATQTHTYDMPSGVDVAIQFLPFLFLLFLGFIGLVYRIGVRNVVLSAAVLDLRHQLLSDVPRLGYAWVAISNILATMFTIGLMRPWAAVRMARYTNAHTGIRIHGDPGDVISNIEASGSAISAEYVDMEGFDFGF
ncbi:YjgN family protein [Pleomorphomonas sp. PLEO]|uniref:YjgN family protein n=1 Tax=Pleomorphomonas sp. PLEO TaxID=3239306 RepID=UPI00351EFE3E